MGSPDENGILISIILHMSFHWVYANLSVHLNPTDLSLRPDGPVPFRSRCEDRDPIGKIPSYWEIQNWSEEYRT